MRYGYVEAKELKIVACDKCKTAVRRAARGSLRGTLSKSRREARETRRRYFNEREREGDSEIENERERERERECAIARDDARYRTCVT